MIACHVGRNPLEYVGYGCYCGIGGEGVPKDQTDRYKYTCFVFLFFYFRDEIWLNHKAQPALAWLAVIWQDQYLKLR